MKNLDLWDKFKEVPESALKVIKGGRLAGMSDISPVWRLKTLTEAFGPCGFGWWYEITDKHLERTDSGEVAAFVDIALYYVVDGITSKPVYGTGGSAFIAKEKSGLYVSDECYKMALTDAISVACKALGIGADVYWQKDATKYTEKESGKIVPAESPAPKAPDEPAQPSEFVDTEEAKLRKIILDLAKAAKRDEAAAMKFCKEVIRASTGNAVEFDDMNVGELAFCKVKLADKIAGK